MEVSSKEVSWQLTSFGENVFLWIGVMTFDVGEDGGVISARA